MANWHVRAVLQRRDEYEDQIDRDIMTAIAIHIGEDSSPARMGLATIAELAGVHYNTADVRTKALASCGKLIIGKQGRYLTYNLPFIAERQASDEHGPARAERDQQGEIDELRKEVAELKAAVNDAVKMVRELHSTFTAPSHDVHMTFTTDQRADVNQEVKKGSSEESIYTPAGDLPPMVGGIRHESKPERDDDWHSLLTAVSEVVKTSYWAGNEPEYHAAIDALRQDGVTRSQVVAFGDWWRSNGYYRGKPSLKSLLGEIKNSVAGVSVRASPNGHGSKHPDVAPAEPERVGGLY